MQYVIHTTNKRLWYVRGYLIPSMTAQGIQRQKIKVFNDNRGIGNLKALMTSYAIYGYHDTCHMNDDVLISSDFAEKTQQYYEEEVVCGFAAKCCQNSKGTLVHPIDMWYSFPCILISERLNREFHEWLKNEAPTIVPDCFWIRDGKGDDALFKSFLTYKYPTMDIRQLKPNIVNHIDYLLGGSIISPQRTKDATSAFWNEPKLVKDLEKKLKEDGNL